MIERVHWLGHASFRIDGKSAVVYIDPWKLKKNPVKGDIVLVTHEHFDHLSPPDVAAALKPGGAAVGPAPVAESLRGAVGKERVRVVAPGDSLELSGVKIRAVPAYNTEAERQGFHPRDKGKPRVGYIVTLDGATIYHAGDTDYVPEMEGLAPDILLLPVGGTYTLDAKQAAAAAAKINPGLTVPMHWGDIVGSRKDAEAFKALFHGQVKILEVE